MKSIAGYLGDGYTVLSSVGHIRDLAEPKNLPAEKKKGGLGKFAVDIDNGFEPFYVVSDSKKKTVAELKKALKDADELLLATDEDREGEAIAWHLLQVLNPKVPVKRMVFHEITKDAIVAATQNTRELDVSLVDAQETRRILDRIYGYEISPVLWRKVGPSLSAGRVQSAATRLIVERERERLAFVPASYWDLSAKATAQDAAAFDTRLVRINGERIASGRDFDDHGQLTGKAVLLDEARTTAIAAGLAAATDVVVSSVESKPYSRRPAAPFTTSTLQQEAGRKLRFSAKQTMSVAQSLYENGYITYMRTDSPGLSTQAVNAARAQATDLYGADSIPAKPRVYTGKAKGAQEAHEAIRPSGDTFRTPQSLAGALSGNDFKLYDLIWKRTVASQMADAKGQTATVTLASTVDSDALELTASGTVITFRGFLNAYEESQDEERGGSQNPKEAKLPPLTEGQSISLSEVEAKGHETTPPPRYTEASLVKTLEELGIGRPSTYAQTIATIVDRGYVSQRGQALIPSWIAFSVVRLLEQHFTELVQYDFTAAMEADLDQIAAGDRDRTEWLSSFYFGSQDHTGLRQVIDNLGEIDAREINSIPVTDSITLRIGKYGPYLEVPAEDSDTPRRVNLPQDLAPDELTPAKAQELVDAPVVTDRVLGQDPESGRDIVAKDGRFGPYVTEVFPEPEPEVDPATGEVIEKPKPKRGTKAAAVKPRTASLFKSMSLDDITLDTAMALLTLPRVVGVDTESEAEITAQNGRYGAYLKKGTDTRSLESEEQIFDITLEGALALFAQPKFGNRRAASALKEFAEDPVSGKPVRVKDGRFGPYITDGTTNVTIPKSDTIEDLTFERAVELLAEKRAKGPAKKAAAKKPAAKKPAAKKPATKTAAAKTTAATKTKAAGSTEAKKPATTRAAAAKKTAAQRAADATAQAAATESTTTSGS
ncbi:MAG: type I DNA topoisomerase [Mycetocola sp.]